MYGSSMPLSNSTHIVFLYLWIRTFSEPNDVLLERSVDQSIDRSFLSYFHTSQTSPIILQGPKMLIYGYYLWSVDWTTEHQLHL